MQSEQFYEFDFSISFASQDRPIAKELAEKELQRTGNLVKVEDYNNKILQQLNQYVKEFGDKNRFSFIFGAAGNGSLMYGTESADITDEAIEFANERFQGEPLNE